MMTKFECDLIFDEYQRKSLFLSISDKMLIKIVEESVIIISKFAKYIIKYKEYENFSKGYINKYIKTQIRNVRIISEYFFSKNNSLISNSSYNHLKNYLDYAKNFYGFTLKYYDQKKILDNTEEYDYFAMECLRGIVYYSVIIFDLDCSIYNENLLINKL